MPITADQQRQLLQKAKEKNPNLSLEEAKLVLQRANELSDDGAQTMQSPTQQVAGGFGKLFELLNPQSVGAAKQAGFGAALAGEAGRQQQQIQKQTSEQNRLLLDRAARESDPAKKQMLLDQSRRLSEVSGEAVGNIIGGAENQLGIEGGKQLASPLRTGVAVAGEQFASLAPAGILGKGATTGGRIAKAAQVGALRGGVVGATSPDSQSARELLNKALGGAALGGVIGGGIGAVGEAIGSAGRSIKKPEAKVLPEGADEIERILTKAENVPAENAKSTPGVFKRIYQSAFPFSKKGNAFERLRPEETVDDMIRYGISGSGDDIQVKAQQLSGQRGVLTNIVNDAIATSPNQSVTLPDVDERRLVERFSDVGSEEARKQLGRISNLPTGTNPGQVDLSSMADLERTFMKEGFDDFVRGSTTKNNKLLETAALKFELADELSNSVNKSVGEAALDRYKDPRVVEFITQVGGKNLADDFANAKTISDLRTLQKSFVRMSQIVDLSNQLPSSLGQRFFRTLSNFPGIGPVVDSIIEPVGQSLGTGLAVGGARAAQSAPVQAGASIAASPQSRQAFDLLARLGVLGSMGSGQNVQQ